jgi:hypothetical protein
MGNHSIQQQQIDLLQQQLELLQKRGPANS